MDISEKIKRVDNDLDIGRVKRAIDRLHGFIYTYPNELIFRNKLGEVYHKIHYLENAGRYWYLTENKTDEMKSACEIYEKSVNSDPLKILTDIKFRGELDKLDSTFAQQKIQFLQEESKKKYNWFPDYRSKIEKNNNTKDDWTGYVFVGCLITVLILTVIGLISVIKWIF